MGQNSETIITSSQVSNVGGFGIFYHSLIALDNVTIQDCGKDMIQIEYQNCKAVVSNSQVSNIGGHGIYCMK